MIAKVKERLGAGIESVARRIDIPTVSAVVEDIESIISVSFLPEDEALVPWIWRNHEFQVVTGAYPEAVARILLKDFRALTGPPWQLVPDAMDGMNWGLISNPGVVELPAESTVTVHLMTDWPNYGQRLISFTVVVTLTDGRQVSFVDPWDELPYP